MIFKLQSKLFKSSTKT